MHEPSRFGRAIFGLVLLLVLSRCGISEQVQQAKAFKNAEFRRASVEQATVAGIDVSQIRQPGDLSTGDKLRLATGNVPLQPLLVAEQLYI
jgi:GH25 family lysozyme M1 (1,4-beta-N-acetylmuramidase)